MKTNRISLAYDGDLLNNIYDVYIITTTEKYIKRGALVLDKPLLNKKVKSIFFDDSKKLYLLLDKTADSLQVIKDAINEEDTLTFKKIKFNDLEQNIIIQLLLNAMHNFDSDILKFSNLTGHLFCFDSSWIDKEKKGEEYTNKQVHCLEIKVNSSNNISLNVATFTNLKYCKYLKLKKSEINKLPKYTTTLKNTLIRVTSDKKENRDIFIRKQFNNKKYEINYLDFKSFDSFKTSKMGVLDSIVEAFNEFYDGLAHMKFLEINDYSVLCPSSNLSKENSQKVLSILKNYKIKLVDKIQDDSSKIFCKIIKENIKTNFGIDISICKRIDKEAANIVLIHNKDYYSDGDQYIDKKDCNTIIQHITIEDFSIKNNFIISTIFNELVIKDDLSKNKISLYDWKSLGYSNSISFGLKECIDNQDRFFFMEISPDGSFTIKEQVLDLFQLNQFSDCIAAFEDNKKNNKNTLGLIRDSFNNINSICDTGWYMIPEIHKISTNLKSGNNKLRSKESREEMLESVTDIKQFCIDENYYYFVGVVGSGMRNSVLNSSLIRQIVPFRDSKILIDDIKPLMNVGFVRNGQLTVVPFPFKYIREYISTNYKERI